MSRLKIAVTGICLVAAGGAQAGSGVELLGPIEYICEDDSPFDLEELLFENFEDGLFNVRWVSAAGSVTGPGGLTDSVDCDDGVIDGSGTAGRSFFHGSGAAGITFQFCAEGLGGYPTHAGVVWTDGEGTQVRFEAFDPDGKSLGVVLGDHVGSGVTGQTDEDRFYGVIAAGGVSAIHISNTSGGIEVDHLQYGPAEDPCLADITGDCVVGFTDLLALLNAWGVCAGCIEDLDGSGAADFVDLLTLLSSWGPCR